MRKSLNDMQIQEFMNSNKEIIQEKEYTILNLGPTHPATHGIFQNVMKMDGEIIVEAKSTTFDTNAKVCSIEAMRRGEICESCQ